MACLYVLIQTTGKRNFDKAELSKGMHHNSNKQKKLLLYILFLPKDIMLESRPVPAQVGCL